MDFALLEDLLKFLPFALVLTIGVFRMDQLFSTPKLKPQRAARHFCGVRQSGRFVFTDPDGRNPRSRSRL